MVARGKYGITKPNPRYILLSITFAPSEPKTVIEALKHLGWNGAMTEEIDSSKETETFSLVPYHPDMHILGCKWVLIVC